MSMPSNAMSAALAKARAFNPGQPQPRPGFGAGAGPVNTGSFPPGGGGNTGPFPPGGAGGFSPMPMPMPQMPMAAPDSMPPQGMPQMAGAPMGGPPGMPPPGNTGIIPPHMRQPQGPVDAASMGGPMAPMNRARFMGRKPNRGTMMNMLRQKMGGGSGMGMRVPQELRPTMPAPVAAPLS